MKKRTLLLAIGITFFIFMFLNLGYYVATNWQNFFPKKVSELNKGPKLTRYENAKLGIELDYPAEWVVTESENKVEINPVSKKEWHTYFSITERMDFDSVGTVKSKLSPSLPTIPVEINGVKGFTYSDTDDHEITWISYNNKLFMIRAYVLSQKSDQIIASIRFK